VTGLNPVSILRHAWAAHAVIAIALVAIHAPAAAQPFATIQTPPQANLAALTNAASLRQLVLANLVASNCRLPNLSSGDAALLAGTAQSIAELLGVTTEQYFSGYIHPAMLELAAPDGCTQQAQMTGHMVAMIKGLGGKILAP